MARKKSRKKTAPRTSEEDLKQLLDAGAGDKVVLDAYDQRLFSPTAERSAAEAISTAGLICARRPHLTEHCLRPVVAACRALGADIPIWVTAFGEAVARYPEFTRIAGPDGTRWLREELPNHSALIKSMLDELRRKRKRSK